jgi:hypothetical protein
MVVDVVQELDPDDPQLEIPWADPDHPESRFVDLRRFPEETRTLAECRQYPALAALLLQANSLASPFRTAKSDAWTTSELAEDERLDFGLPHKLGSYVDLAYDHGESRWSIDAHLRSAEKLAQALKDLRVQAQMEIAVRRCLFHPEERWGYYCTLFLHAYGATPEEAEREWTRALTALGAALTMMDEADNAPAPQRAPG